VKASLKKYFTLLMVLAIFANSHTYAFYEHICLITKIRTISLKPSTCDDSEKDKAQSEDIQFSKKTCCDVNTIVNVSPDNDTAHHPSFHFVSSIFTVIPDFEFQSFVEQSLAVLYAGDTSPPFIKSKLFILLEVFRI
jgi:hypothetical protein